MHAITITMSKGISIRPCYVFVSECVTDTVMADHLSSSIHSLSRNSIRREGAMAVAAAMKTAINLRVL